jgi:hypothetical protein
VILQKVRPQFAGVRELNFESFIYHAPDTHGAVQTQEWQATFRANFHNGSYTDNDIVDVFAQRLTTPIFTRTFSSRWESTTGLGTSLRMGRPKTESGLSASMSGLAGTAAH